MVAQGPASDFDTQVVVEYMTTGAVNAGQRPGVSGTDDRHRRRPGRLPERARRGSRPSGRPGGAVAPEELVALAPDVLADSLGDYLRAWWKRIRGGESGALPIIIGLIVICIFFEVQSSAFLTAGNIVNLFVQAAFIILLGLAELYALILSEIDLSVGFVGAVGRRHRARPDGRAAELALVGRADRRHGRLRRHRRLPGRPHHQAQRSRRSS